MSAKKYSPSKKSQSQPVSAAPAPSPAPAAVSVAAEGDTASEPAWYDSSDPRKRAIAKAVFVALWIYVAALWLLALDQWFNWGIFGPKIPPTP